MAIYSSEQRMTDKISGQPPYPADTKAKGWRFELDYEVIQQSDTWALADEVPLAQPALLMMWLTAWSQIPCGSFPNDEGVIRAKCKVPAKDWARMREVLMRGWWLASDGRLYHPTITQRVVDMLGRKDGERHRKAEWRSRKEAERQLADANAKAKESHGVTEQRSGQATSRNATEMSQVVPPMSHGTDIGQTWDRHGTDDTGTGTGTGTGLDSSNQPPECGREPEIETLSHGTAAGHICKAMRQAGMGSVNPSNQTLLVLIEAGATEAEFVSAAKKAAAEQKGFAYALGIVTGERKRAAFLSAQVHRGALQEAISGPQRARFDRANTLAPGAARKPATTPKTDFIYSVDQETRNVVAFAGR